MNAANSDPSPRRLRGWLMHGLRVSLFIAIIWLVHDSHRWFEAQQAGQSQDAVTLQRVQAFFPDAAALADWDPSHGGRAVVNAEGNPIGFIILTSPQSNTIVGFSGPSTTMIAFGQNDRILGMDIVRSGDTVEHINDVKANLHFMTSLHGLTWKEARQRREVDAVSGATLSSLAIREGIIRRLGGDAPKSGRFPKPIAIDEVRRFFPTAAALSPSDEYEGRLVVIDDAGLTLGSVFRTSPAADSTIGYQGPTDTLVALDGDDKVAGILLRHSYDNEPYVGYVREEEYFLTLFNGKTLNELATLDLNQAGVEGVSGATMTSQAVARGLFEAARQQVESKRAAQVGHASAPLFAWRMRDIGTTLVIVFALILAFTPLRKSPRLRLGFQVILIVYLGFINGDMVSQSLLVGWSQAGMPWRFAPGMILLVAAALLVPITTKRQVYCHHLCPHGALQELLKNRLPWQLKLSHRATRVLAMLPAMLLLWVVIVAVTHLPASLVGIEPFDAYILSIAGWATITVAIVGLIASLFVPMAYCRFGCPTGALLNFLRRSGASDRISRRDLVAAFAVLLAVCLRFI